MARQKNENADDDVEMESDGDVEKTTMLASVVQEDLDEHVCVLDNGWEIH